MGTYRHCSNSTWYRRKPDDDEYSETFVSPFIGLVGKYDWEGMGGGSTGDPSQMAGIVTVKSKMSESSLNQMVSLARTLKKEQKEALTSWLTGVWELNDTPGHSALTEFFDFEGGIAVLEDMSVRARNIILSSVEALLDVETREVTRAKYLKRPAFRPLLMREQMTFFLERGSTAHVISVTHKKHKAEEGPSKVVEKISDVVKEGEETDEGSGRLDLLSVNDIDPFTLGAILGAAQDAVLVDNANEAADAYLLKTHGISDC